MLYISKYWKLQNVWGLYNPSLEDGNAIITNILAMTFKVNWMKVLKRLTKTYLDQIRPTYILKIYRACSNEGVNQSVT